MSEFKFACPVCGQHITAASATSGSQIECPTCFQKIVVPQAPASGDSKLILSATQVGKPRPSPTELGVPSGPRPGHSPRAIPYAAILLLLLCAAGALAFVFRDRFFKPVTAPGPSGTNRSPRLAAKPPRIVHPIPTNVSWSLELTNMTIPDAVAVGSIRGNGFLCERSTLRGGELTLRQGKAWPPDLGVTVYLFAQQGEDLSGKVIEVEAARPPPLPRVTLRWKDDQDKAVTRNFYRGYALKIVFGAAANGRMPGKLFLSFPDDARSFVAGTFNAEIRKSNPPNARPPTPPKPPPPRSPG